MTQRNEILVLEYPIKSYRPLIVFSFVIVAALLISLVGGLVGIIRGHDISSIRLAVVGLEIFLFLQVYLWFYRGRERIEVYSDTVDFVRTNGMLTFRKRVKSSAVKDVKINPKTFDSDSFMDTGRQSIKEMQGALFFWYNMGRLEFKFEKSHKTFFNGLPDKDAGEVVQKLLRAIRP